MGGAAAEAGSGAGPICGEDPRPSSSSALGTVSALLLLFLAPGALDEEVVHALHRTAPPRPSASSSRSPAPTTGFCQQTLLQLSRAVALLAELD